MPATTEARLRVAICGGGIGGLALACALSKVTDITVDVYEAASEFQEIGAGVMLRPRNLRFLTELGLMNEIAAINGRSSEKTESAEPAMAYYRANKAELDMVTHMVEGNGSVMMHRAEFHGILLGHIPKEIGLHKLKRLVSYSDPADDGSLVRLFFADGTRATCDVLVGADGIRSAVRATMLNELAESTEDKAHAERLRDRVLPRYSGVVTHRIVLPREKFSQLSPDSTVWTMGKLYLGDGVFIVTYPVSQGRLLNVAVTTVNYDLEWTLHPHPWVSYVKAEKLLPLFEGWAQEARGVIAGLEGTELKKWVINVVNPLDEWSAGRITLLGDAAHGMVPFQGAGAGQAIEDAHILSTLLAHPRTTRQTVQHALRAYSDVRVPIAAKFFAASRKNGLLITNTKTLLSDCAAELRELADSAWCSRHPEVESRRAVEEFEAALVGVV